MHIAQLGAGQSYEARQCGHFGVDVGVARQFIFPNAMQKKWTLSAQVVDPETGRELPLGSTGELHMRGPTVMKGYLNRPQATAETIDKDGWLRTGAET